MKKILLVFLIVLCILTLVCCGKPSTKTDSEFEQVEINYRDYTDHELLAVKNMLEDRMSELGITVLGIGEDWVNVQVYELSEELESYLVAEIFPKYKSSVVKISIIPADVEIRFA